MRVLVVDDNDDIVLLLRFALVSHGIDVISAAGGPQALEWLKHSTPDAVILDIQMPEMDGWETLRRIRTGDVASDVPVILCTVKGRPVDAHRGWEAGCDGYVMKPFEIESLVAEVRSVTSRDANDRERFRREGLAQAKDRLEEALRAKERI